MTTAQLALNINSTINKNKVYGLQGEHVTIIAQHGSTYLVQNVKGDRYAVNECKLIIEKPSA